MFLLIIIYKMNNYITIISIRAIMILMITIIIAITITIIITIITAAAGPRSSAAPPSAPD